MTQPDPAVPTTGAVPKTTGYKSTEAWLATFKALVTAAIAFCTLFGVGIPTWLRPDAPWVGIAALVVGGVVVSLYGKDRTDLKKMLVARLVSGAWVVTNLPGGAADASSPAPDTVPPAQPDPDPSLVDADEPPADAPDPPGAGRAQDPASAPADLGQPEPAAFLGTAEGKAAVRRGAARGRTR